MKKKYRIEFESIANRLDQIQKKFLLYDDYNNNQLYILEKEIREFLLKKSKSYKKDFINKCQVIFELHNFKNQIIK